MRHLRRIGLCALLLGVCLAGVFATAQTRPAADDRLAQLQALLGVSVERDIVYGKVDGQKLLLDLHLPRDADQPLPVVLWIHGGGWSMGSKDRCPAAPLVRRGYAVASVGYRLAPDATWPAQIQDCQAAVRFLRANAEKYGLDGKRIGAWGASAGGHLAAMLGVLGDDAIPATGGNDGISSRVQAVCDCFGPTDLASLPDPPGRPNNPVVLLLGGPVAENADKARQASPITHASADDPPMLIMHGDADRLVPLDQSRLLHQALTDAGADVTLKVIPGAGHGGREFATPEVIDQVAEFFDKHLKPAADRADTRPAGSQPTSAPAGR